jgi:hypothetical protein
MDGNDDGACEPLATAAGGGDRLLPAAPGDGWSINRLC